MIPLQNQPINLSSEFVHQCQFETLAQLRLELFDYVRGGTICAYMALAYETPRSIRQRRDWQRQIMIMEARI